MASKIIAKINEIIDLVNDDVEFNKCPECGGYGTVTHGEFDDIVEKRCHCKTDNYDSE